MKVVTLFKLIRSFVAVFCIGVLAVPPPLFACMGTRIPTCVFNPASCLKTLTLTKSAPAGMVNGSVGFPGGIVSIEFHVFAQCPTCPFTACANPAFPTLASVTINFYPAPLDAGGNALPCPATEPAGPPTFSYTGSLPSLPACTTNGATTTYLIPTPVPLGAPLGVYCAFGTVSVTFSDGLTLTATGDTSVCVVDPLPGQPGVPRLGITLLSSSLFEMAPGDTAVARYLIVNNDTKNSVQLTAFADSRQRGVRPQGGNEAGGVYSPSTSFGDDFPILFNPSDNCVPLPPHPYTQPIISNTLPLLGPGQSNLVMVGIRSYGQCADGSCCESRLEVMGTYSDGTPALACSSVAHHVNTFVTSQFCALQVNDCNHNGRPDALDIATGVSQDLNFNALPDECEPYRNIPASTSVTPQTVAPGAPILARIAFQEIVGMASVWANGYSLIRTQTAGIPFWQGTIPADMRPGPQSVAFIAKDTSGVSASSVATYEVVQVQPTITDVQPRSGAMGDVITIHGSGFGTNPATLCAGIHGETPVALHVLSAAETFITARIDAVCSTNVFTPVTGFVGVAQGVGNFNLFTPAFPNITVLQNWTWQNAAVGAGSTIPFTAFYTTPEPGQKWFYPVVSNGVMSFFLQGDWGTNASVNLDFHLRTTNTWYDTHPRTLFAGSGTLQECARLVKDVIVCSIQQNDHVLLPADIIELPGGGVQIIVRGPNNQTVLPSSYGSICVGPPTRPLVNNISLNSGVSGSIITLAGSGFGSNPNNLCINIAGPVPVPLRALTATDSQITARVGLIPPGAGPGPIQVTRGDGNVGPFIPAFPDIQGVGNTWTWVSREAPMLGTVTFNPIYTAPPCDRQYFYGHITNGVLSANISGNWPTNASVRIETHFNSGGVHYDVQSTNRFIGGGSTLDCTARVKDLVSCALSQRAGVFIPGTVTQLAPSQVRIDIFGPGYRRIDSGSLTICVSVPVPQAPVLTVAQGANRSVVLSWTDCGGILQTAPSVSGPWTVLPGSTNPFTTAATAPAQFYRVYLPQ